MKKSFYVMLVIISTTVGVSQEIVTFNQKTIIIGNSRLVVEVADNPSRREQGLMYRKSLPEENGMLFIFDTSEMVGFWMKNTYIPLDIGFFDEDKVLFDVHSMKPLSTDVTYSSKKAKYALEVNEGWFERHSIKLGINFSYLKKPGSETSLFECLTN